MKKWTLFVVISNLVLMNNFFYSMDFENTSNRKERQKYLEEKAIAREKVLLTVPEFDYLSEDQQNNLIESEIQKTRYQKESIEVKQKPIDTSVKEKTKVDNQPVQENKEKEKEKEKEQNSIKQETKQNNQDQIKEKEKEHDYEEKNLSQDEKITAAKGFALLKLNFQPEYLKMSKEDQTKALYAEAFEILQQINKNGLKKTEESVYNFLKSLKDKIKTNDGNKEKEKTNEHEQKEEGFLNSEWKRFTLEKTKFTEKKINTSINSNISKISSLLNDIRFGISRAVIFNGPSGSGKTTLAEAIAVREKVDDYVVINSSSVIGRYQGSGATNICNIFDKAQQVKGKFIIIFDEIDKLLIPAKDQDQSSKGTMQSRVDTCLNNYPNITIIGTSNYAHNLSTELRGRFSIIEIPFPNFEKLKEMVTDTLHEYFASKNFTDEQIKRIAQKLNNRSLRLIENAIKDSIGHLNIEQVPQNQNTVTTPNNSPSTSNNSLKNSQDRFIVHSTPEEIVAEVVRNIPDYRREQLDNIRHEINGFVHRQGENTSTLIVGGTGVGGIAALGLLMRWIAGRIWTSRLERSQIDKNEAEIRTANAIAQKAIAETLLMVQQGQRASELHVIECTKKINEEIRTQGVYLTQQLSQKVESLIKLIQTSVDVDKQAYTLHTNHENSLVEQLNKIDSAWDNDHTI